MTQAEIILLIFQYAIKYGIDAALAVANVIKSGGATIDEAILVLEKAKAKTAQDYLDEAKAAALAAGTLPGPT